jgi:YbbR domain-containing protein
MRWIFANIRSIFLAFILAVVVWISAVTASDPDVERAYPTPIPIEIIGQDPGLVPVGEIATSVDLTIKAPQSILNELIEKPDLLRVVADLSGLNAGIHQVPLHVQINLRPAQVVAIDPPSLNLVLEPLTTRVLKVDLTVNGEPAVGYKLGDPVIDPPEVVISGPQSLVDQIVEVQTQVSVSNARQNVDTTVQLLPLDGKNQPVNGANLNPDSVKVLVPVTQQGGYRDLAVKVVVTGQVASGYRLTNISVFPPVVTVYSADPNVVNAMPGFVETQSFNLNDAKQNIETRLTLVLPAGVAVVGEQSVLVQASISPIMSSITIANKNVELLGLDPHLGAQISPTTVDVILSGPLPVLDQLTPEDVRVLIDLTGLGMGTYQVDPKVEILVQDVQVESINPTTLEVVLGPPLTPTLTKNP